MKQVTIYCLKVWLTMSVLSASLIWIINICNLESNKRLLQGVSNSYVFHYISHRVIVAFFGGSLLNLIAVLGVFVTLYLLRTKPMTKRTIKLCITLVALLIVLLPWAIICYELKDDLNQRIAIHAYVRNTVIDGLVTITSI